MVLKLKEGFTASEPLPGDLEIRHVDCPDDSIAYVYVTGHVVVSECNDEMKIVDKASGFASPFESREECAHRLFTQYEWTSPWEAA